MKAFDALGNSSIGGPKITFYPGTDPTAGSGIEFALSNVKNSRGTLSSLTGAMNLVDDPTDPELTKLVFDFACKLPANYAEGISLYDKATGVQVALAPENLIYTENGETSQLTIDPGVLTAESTYVIKFSKAFSSSTGTSIGFDVGWEFITASADKEIPTWGDGAALNVDFLISPMTATLSWSAAIDNLQVTQYKLFKGEEVLAVLPGETREYLAEDLSVATEYTFKVQAGDYLNNWSTLLEKTMTSPAADITPPGWGTGTLSFTNINSDNVTLNWSAASGEYAVKDYLIYKNDDSQPSAMVGSDVFTYLAGGLTGETSYTFKIVARDYSGNLSAPLSNDVITAVDNVLPTWPVNAFLNAKDLKSDSFTLYWQAALDNIGIDHYNIYQDGEMIGSTADSTTTEYPIAGLEATTKYTFMVEAVDTSDNKTADKLIFEQSTTVSGPTEGAGIEFTMTSPANENVGKSGNAMLNRVTEPMLDANIIFTFDFAKDLASSTLLANVELVENDDVENPIQLQAEYFSYTFANGIGALKLEIPQNLVDMGTSYQLKLMSSLEAKDGSTLGKDYIWEFNVAQGLYGIKDIAAGVNSYSAFESAADRFYLMVKSDGTVWGWGNNLYGHLGDGTTQDSAVPVQALNLQNITKVVAGVNSAFAVDADGGVWGWGSNEHGQLGKGTLPTGTSGRYGNETPQKIAGLPPIAKLVYGFNRCVALDVNGDVWTWGFRTSVYQSPYGVLSTGTPAKVPFLSNIKDVATGWQTSLAVTADGKVWEWAGIDGTPAEVDGLTEVKSVAMDSFNYTKNNMALKKDGTLWYWGEGTIVVTIPGSSNKLAVDLMQVEGAENVKEIYTKSMAVLTDDRSVRSVDVDFAAKSAILGDVISNLTDISKLAVYTTSSRTNPVSGGLALKLDGTLLQFIADVVVPIDPGMNAVDPPVWPDESAVIFSNLTEQGLTLNWNSCREGISAYAVYQNGSLVKTLPGDQLSYSITGLTKGQAYTFKVEARMAGSNFTANGPSASVTLTDWNPTMQGAGKIAAGTGHSLMIDADGSVWAWGSNESGQLGIGSNADQLTPQKIEGLNNITAVAVGNSHSLALDGEGNVWVWGSNTKYQLGLGTTENRNVPVKLAAISGVTGISAAGNYNLAVKSDGTLWSWGEPCNANLNYAISGIDGKTPGQMKYGTPSPAINYYYQNVKSAVASPNFYAVLFADGTISRSGSFIDNVGAGTYWTMLYNPGLMGVQAISAGNDFLMALLEDGTVAVMGDNSQGQYGNGTRINPTPATAAAYKKVTGLESVVAISAGGAHGLALKADGSVWGWGQNNKGQIGNGNTTTQLIPTGTIKISDIYVLDAGSSYSIVLKDDTAANIEAYAFGDNSKGQLGTGSTLSSTEVKRIIFPGFVDNIAPTFPAWFAIYAIGLSDNSATILWSEAEDNTAVATYEIWQDNVKVGEVTGDKRAFTVTGLISGQTYEIGIKALDTAGNISSLSRITKISIDNIVVDGNSGVSLRLPNQEVTVPNNSFLDVSSGLAVKSNDTIQVGGQSIDLTQFAIEGESQQNLTQPVNVGDQQVTIAQAVQLKSAIATQPTIIKNAAVTNISASISDGTTILAPQGWDGTIKPPTNVTTAGTAPSGFTVGNSVIEVGSPNGVLIFDKPVILTLTGVTGSNFGYKPAGSNTWVKMSQAAGTYDNPTAPAFPGEAYITNGTDTKIITWHFPQFASLSEVSTSGSGSSGGGSGSGEGSGTVGGLSVSYTVNKNAVQNVVLRFDFSNGIDNNLTSNLNLIRVYEKSTGNNVNYSDYEYIKEGSQDTGNKIRRLELYFDNLKSSTNYIVELGGGFKANNGSTLGVKNAFEFTTIAEATSSGQTNTETGEKVETPVTPINVLKLNDIAGHWAEKSITKLVASGAISGYPDGDFKPDAKITRAEFVTVLVKAFKLETKTGKLFNDTTNSWAKDYIATANAYGIVNGYDDLSFGPDDLITREQMIVMLIKAARLTSATSQTTFTDSDSISSWARNSIAIAIQTSLIKGYPANTFGPSLNASRAEGITVLCNALN
jgi:alpha-tubulin suppressor-like RCC1 family protein